MLIGIDASRTVTDRPTGTEVYSRCLIQALLAISARHRFRLYFRSAPPADLFPGNGLDHTEVHTIPFPRLWTHARLSWEMARHPPDILLVPAHVLPLVHPRASLVTVHDLGYLYFPQAHRGGSVSTSTFPLAGTPALPRTSWPTLKPQSQTW